MTHFSLIRDPELRRAVEAVQGEMDILEGYITKYKNGEHDEKYIDLSMRKIEQYIEDIPHDFISGVYRKRLQTYKSDFDAYITNNGK
eukprot:g76316.t1